MSHARRRSKVYRCVLSTSGTVELLADGETIWASDADEDFMDEYGLHVTSEQLGDVLEYLVGEGYLTDRQADDCWVVEPEPEQTNGAAPLEGEFIPKQQDEDANL